MSNSAQSYTVNDAVQLSESVYAQLSAADDAGANITSLAQQYNSALALISRAQRLESSGNQTGAASLAGKAISILQVIPPQAEKLKADALSRRETARVERMILTPIEALSLAVFVAVTVAVRRRVKFKQLREMRLVAK